MEIPETAPQPFFEVSTATLAHYERVADSFRESTRDHDVTQNIDTLLRHLSGNPPLDILDLGCGPGRDLREFVRRGHRPVGLDGSSRFVAMARAESGCEVWQQDLLALNLPAGRFDGVFANAVLFHVPTKALPTVLACLFGTLRAGGVLFSSNPRGNNVEGWSGERYGVWHDLQAWRGFLTRTGFIELEHYYRPPGLPRDQQPWLATVWRRPGGVSK